MTISQLISARVGLWQQPEIVATYHNPSALLMMLSWINAVTVTFVYRTSASQIRERTNPHNWNVTATDTLLIEILVDLITRSFSRQQFHTQFATLPRFGSNCKYPTHSAVNILLSASKYSTSNRRIFDAQSDTLYSGHLVLRVWCFVNVFLAVLAVVYFKRILFKISWFQRHSYRLHAG